jgi:hypothetical protein
MGPRVVCASVPGLMLAAALALLPAERAEAQYRSYTFGFETGYMALTEGTELRPHNFAVGLFGGYKLSDNWWFSGRALVSFPGQLDLAPNTVVLLHLVPVSVQYYFLTDAFRPYVGLSNSFQFLVNNNTSTSVFWGPGVQAGMEFKLRRDLFLGLKADGYMMLVFEGPPAAVITTTAQLIFFL